MRRIVLDTNVLVSGLLNPFGAPGRILDMVLSDDLQLIIDDRILAEYREVLHRNEFGFHQSLVKTLLDYIDLTAEHVYPAPLGIPLRDPDDVMFLEVAIAGGAHALVTGNKRHYPREAVKDLRVVNPAELLADFRKGT